MALAAKEFIILIGPERVAEKRVEILGSRGRVPVEVVPFAVPLVRHMLGEVRLASEQLMDGGAPAVTDNGNHLIHVLVDGIESPTDFDLFLKGIPGVVETGLFLDMADAVFIEADGETEELRRADRPAGFFLRSLFPRYAPRFGGTGDATARIGLGHIHRGTGRALSLRHRLRYGRDAGNRSGGRVLPRRQSHALGRTGGRAARGAASRRSRAGPGARHIGGFALSAAAIGCEVLAVEASPRNAELLRRSVAYNRFANCHVVEAAVADKPGSVSFTVRGPYGQVGVPVDGVPVVTVPAVRADDLLRERGWHRVRFVKLDVEGFEIPALHGLERTLQSTDAPMIYFESNTHTLAMYNQTDADLKGTLRRFGYAIYDVGPGTLRRADRDGQSEVVMDYLAAKRLPQELRTWLPQRRPSLAFRAVRKLLRMTRVRR